MVKTREDMLAKLFELGAEYLVEKFQSGEATDRDFKNLVQWLKDNNVTCEVRKGTPLAGLLDSLPFDEHGDLM